MKTLNKYFFGVDDNHPSDIIWYIGGLSTMLLIAVFTLVSVL